MTDRIFGLAIAALALLVWYLFHRADTEVEASVNRALGPVVPLDDLLHEQDSAEAYDDLPDMDVEAGIPYGPRTMSRMTGSLADAASHIISIEDEGWWQINVTIRRAEENTFLINSVEAYPVDDVDADSEITKRKAWEDEWEERLALDFDGGAS